MEALPHPHAADGAARPVPQQQPDADPDTAAAGHPALAALRARGAQQLDPVGLRYAEALQRQARRRPQGALRHWLDQRLEQAIARCHVRCDTAMAELDAALPVLVQRHPHAAAQLQRLHASADRAGLRQLVAQLAVRSRHGPLATLVRRIDGERATHVPTAGAKVEAAADLDPGPPADLRTVQRFRDTWNRLRVDGHLARSQQQAPENPGPLNSHLLVLRSLRCMQEIAPAYLARFVAHAEALAWLETAPLSPPQSGKPAAARERRAGKAAARRGR